jgi:hypothetical protein
MSNHLARKAPSSRARITAKEEPSHANLTCVFFAITAMFMGGGGARATEGGGSLYGSGIATMLPGVQPTPPGFNFLNYNVYYSADRLNNARGDKAIPNFHLDAAFTSARFDYSLPEPILGIRWGAYIAVPLSRVHLSVGQGAGKFEREKAGLGDMSISPVAGGWEFDTPVGHVNQYGRLTITLPTGSYRPTERVNLGRNYTAYIFHQGNSLFPTEDTHIGFQLNYVVNEKNSATNYQSGNEFDIDWSTGYDISQNWAIDLSGYYYKQVNDDYRSGILVNGDGNKGQAVGIGPQVRFKLHPGAITLKWHTELDVRNRAQGNRFWLQFYHPL